MVLFCFQQLNSPVTTTYICWTLLIFKFLPKPPIPTGKQVNEGNPANKHHGGFDFLPINIFDDDFTPVHATAAANLTVASCAAEHPPKTPANHCQIDLNRVIVTGYQLFSVEMMTK
jgi:hypothetical protein